MAQQPHLQLHTQQPPQQNLATSTTSTTVAAQTMQHQPPVLVAKPSIPTTVSQPAQHAIEEATSAASITVGPDQQQVFYSGMRTFSLRQDYQPIFFTVLSETYY